MSAAVVLFRVWATAVPEEEEGKAAQEEMLVPPEIAFYRKYTEAILHRYVKMSMEAGRAPSLLGREMFRGKVTHYRVHSFEDVVIFVHDVEKCMEELDPEQRKLVTRIGLQEYTHVEAATLLHTNPRTAIRRYGEALDKLTRLFLERRLLEPMKESTECGSAFSCQGGRNGLFLATD